MNPPNICLENLELWPMLQSSTHPLHDFSSRIRVGGICRNRAPSLGFLISISAVEYPFGSVLHHWLSLHLFLGIACPQLWQVSLQNLKLTQHKSISTGWECSSVSVAQNDKRHPGSSSSCQDTGSCWRLGWELSCWSMLRSCWSPPESLLKAVLNQDLWLLTTYPLAISLLFCHQMPSVISSDAQHQLSTKAQLNNVLWGLNCSRLFSQLLMAELRMPTSGWKSTCIISSSWANDRGQQKPLPDAITRVP